MKECCRPRQGLNLRPPALQSDSASNWATEADGYSLESPRWGASNEYPQHMYSSRNKKNIMWIPPLICSYVTNDTEVLILWSDADKVLWIVPKFNISWYSTKIHTVITLSIGTDRPLQTVQTQIRRRRTRRLISVYTVCHTYSNILDTSTGSGMDYFKF